MAEAHIQTEQTPAQTPLLDPEQTQEEVEKDTQLDQALQRLETVLCFLGFHQSSLLSILFSWFIFLLVGVSIPVVALQISRCSDCERYQINKFELHILVSEACLAAVSLLCVSHNLRKYGIRKFLFVDRYHGHMSRFRKEYIRKIEDFFCLLVLWMLPCFLLKTAREVIRAIYVRHESWWQSVAIFLALVVSWTYLTTIFLSACLLFSLVCNLQIIHFEDYGMLLERNHDVSVFIEEHIRLRHHLSKISHRFRIYLLLAFLVVTASQFVTLLQTTGYHGISFINGGDFAVSSIVQVVGIVLCLHAAAKISHRAQGIASVASRWHALLTCSSTDASQLRVSNSMGNLEASNQVGSISINYSESDLESVDYLPFSTNSQLASYMSTYHKRQAFVQIDHKTAAGTDLQTSFPFFLQTLDLPATQ
ncbi:PREDICTED: uncharacterized protein LOC104592942 isoform X2 [Nelumbo nucifera]|uniref:Uncharacterized protein LOC104592942 isoform X2 n=1 Tax=Nelumbo nucifera TaxID=4432 RepID=A0A1U8Q398_NELNU|nr:PREDICTED: uncharacterized protein LOC104592942 isoform X2 [Nelumbo nucifera]